MSGADRKQIMQNGYSDFNRRRFVQLTAASCLAVGTSGPRLMAAAPSETEALVTPQPSPSFSPDENIADIVVDTLIAWGGHARLRHRRRRHQLDHRSVPEAPGQDSLRRRSA
jgi:hypothetical protein